VGTRRTDVAVADAGPLIHLTEIVNLPVLDFFQALHIPDAVWFETVGQGRVREAELLGLGNVHRHTPLQPQVTQFVAENGLQTLHAGERECLHLCRQLGVSVLLTDDLAVREAARRMGLTPVGSLGVVVRASHLGRLSLADAERRIRDLYDVSTLFVTSAIVELAIEQLHSQLKPEA
jgi:predicted nucleic acid-binding protein